MSKKRIYLYSVLVVVFFLVWMFSESSIEKKGFSNSVKVSMREVGHQLLLQNLDSTSLVLPVVEIAQSKYKLSFQNRLSFEPSSLVNEVKKSFDKADLPSYYRVEVKQCSDKEVTYSYEIRNQKEKNIIPCAGRVLPDNCYVIEVKFTKRFTGLFEKQFFLIGWILLLMTFLVEYQFSKRKKIQKSKKNNIEVTKIGVFQFYPEQNKLVKQAEEISLSKKECELLAIFVSRPNEVIKRDELTKKVWEDNGVFVGRSLDTYISKLRKKLKEDDRIKLTNIHGVGYKLEVNC